MTTFVKKIFEQQSEKTRQIRQVIITPDPPGGGIALIARWRHRRDENCRDAGGICSRRIAQIYFYLGEPTHFYGTDCPTISSQISLKTTVYSHAFVCTCGLFTRFRSRSHFLLEERQNHVSPHVNSREQLLLPRSPRL